MDGNKSGTVGRSQIRSMLSVLSFDEAQVVTLRYADGLTQAEIGTAIGLPQQRVSELLASALARLRDEESFVVEFLADG